jgi:hypothetical protein
LATTSTKGTDATQCSFYSYTITRTWTATDKRSNTAIASQLITVQDNTAPIIAPLSNITVTEGAIPTTIANTDNCMASPVVTFTETKVTQTPPPCMTYFYTLARTWTVSDACGNSSTQTQQLAVMGVNLTCPSNKTIGTNADGLTDYNCSTRTTAAMGLTPIFLDNCDFSNLRYEVSGATTGSGNGSVAGLTFPIGTSTITYRLTNSTADNCSFTLTVNDNEAPKMTSAATQVMDLCNFPVTYPSNMLPTGIDNCSGTPTFTITTDVTANVSGCATKTADLKYTKLITRTWNVTDAANNTSTTAQKIYLRDKNPPTAVCKNYTVTIGNTNITLPANTFNNGSSDACSGTLTYATCNGSACTNFSSSIVFSRSMITPSTASSIVLPVRLRVTDACGNISYCMSNVTLQKANTAENTNNGSNTVAKSDTKATDAKPIQPSNVITTHGDLKCFPNPFAEDLNIEYTLASDVDNLTLKIYDIQGRIVKTSNQGSLIPGLYQMRWNLSELASGMYQVCLELNGKCVKMERVVMMK